MARKRRIKELPAGLVLLLLLFCPAFAGENADVFSQPISSDEPTPPQGMPTLPHTVDVPSVRRGSTGRAPAGRAGDLNRALRERSAEKMRRSEEERVHKRTRSQEIRQQAEERRERLRQSGNRESGDGTKYGENRVGKDDVSDPARVNAGRGAAQSQSWLDEPGNSKSISSKYALPKSDFVSTSGDSRPQKAAGEIGKSDAGKIEETQPEITQKRGQDLTVPDKSEEKTKSSRRSASRMEQAVTRVGNRAASRANSLGNRAVSRASNLGNRAVNRALTPLRRAVNTPIRF